jgi:hypothetical protein
MNIILNMRLELEGVNVVVSPCEVAGGLIMCLLKWGDARDILVTNSLGQL